MCRAKIFAFATHGLFNGPAPDRIEKSALDEVVITNTVPLKEGIPEKTNKIKQLSIGKLLSESIQCIHTVRLPWPVHSVSSSRLYVLLYCKYSVERLRGDAVLIVAIQSGATIVLPCGTVLLLVSHLA